MKRIILYLTSVIFSFHINAQVSKTINTPENFEMKSHIMRIEIKDKIGDKVPDPLENPGNYGILINTKEKVISFISENVVRSTGEIINYEKINDISIYLYLDNTNDKCTLVISNSYYYLLSKNMTIRFAILK